MFRSETMCLNQLLFAKESMWDTMNHLAKTEKAMFTPPFQGENKPNNHLSIYANKMIHRTDELNNKLSFVEKKMEEFGWPIAVYNEKASVYVEEIDKYCHKNNFEGPKLFEFIEGQLDEKHEMMTGYCSNYDHILEQRGNLLEKRLGLLALESVVPPEVGNLGGLNNDFDGEGGGGRMGRRDRKFHAILGLIPTENLIKIQKLLFRVSRENILMKSKTLDEVKDPLFQGRYKAKQKTLIFILFPKTEKEVIVKKVNSVLAYYDYIGFEVPNINQKSELLLSLNEELDDNRKILLKTQNEINSILEEFSKPKLIRRLSYINVLKLIIRREENFARNLTYIEEKDGFYQLLIWVPESFIDKLHQELNNIRLSDPTFTKPKIIELGMSGSFNSKYTPPTYFPLNNFTKPFQLIINTYGVPRYKEINPGLFTVVSFPFLFGLMFGDMGHGLMLTLVGVYLILFVKNKVSVLNEVKYLFLLMGLFAFYCGFIYNEFFSVPFLSQDSCYSLDNPGSTYKRNTDNCTYSFGIDWIWFQSSNETQFINSFKMKFSIIVGVIQMLLGIIIKGLNGIYFKKQVDLWFEAIPQFIFLSVTFGYMSFCIIIKWLQDWDGRVPVSIIQLFINFVSVDEALFATPAIQETIQVFFVILTFVCMILMLVPKPFILHKEEKKRMRAISVKSDESDTEHQHKLMGLVS